MKVQFSARKSQLQYPDLTLGRIYEVIGIEADDYRLLNDGGLPYLYPAQLFDLVDESMPEEWHISYGEEGEQYAYAPELNAAGFFEDYFESDPTAVLVFQRYLLRQQALRQPRYELA